MAHGGAWSPRCSCWNASGRCIGSNLAYRSGVLRAGQGGADGSTAHYRRDYRALAGRALQLIMKVADRLDALSGSLQPRAAGVDGVPRRLRCHPRFGPGRPSACPSRHKSPAAVFASLR
jgi:hypothetical protein